MQRRAVSKVKPGARYITNLAGRYQLIVHRSELVGLDLDIVCINRPLLRVEIKVRVVAEVDDGVCVGRCDEIYDQRKVVN